MAGLLSTQNKQWAEDRSAFGYRMLEKMGWREGRGLGLKEDGSTTHVRAKRVAGGGVGMADRAGSAWDVPKQVAAGLDGVLAGLAAVSAGGVTGGKGVRTERKRGFYGRRAAQKDVRNYSETELREIFGGMERRGELSLIHI